MKAIRTVDNHEWVVIDDNGGIATCACPQLLPDSSSITGLSKYYFSHGIKFNPYNAPIEMVVIEIVVKA